MEYTILEGFLHERPRAQDNCKTAYASPQSNVCDRFVLVFQHPHAQYVQYALSLSQNRLFSTEQAPRNGDLFHLTIEVLTFCSGKHPAVPSEVHSDQNSSMNHPNCLPVSSNRAAGGTNSVKKNCAVAVRIAMK
jgi:hypothetical protein